MSINRKMNQSNRARRIGFTLVELLVVIAIIGILIGLLLPAVQAAREAARRSSCMNNMSQLGLALHHFDFSMEHLPSGSINEEEGPVRSEASGQHVSWTVQILPYMEQQAAYEHFDMEAGAYAAVNRDVRAITIPTLLCSSNPRPTLEADDGKSIGLSHYAGNHHDSESPIDADSNGLLFLNSKIRYSQIVDGSSQTILLGEMVPVNEPLGWASGTRATLRNVGSLNDRELYDPFTPQTSLGPLDVGGFGSHHTGGVQFAFADGSVQFLSEKTDKVLLHQLAHRADGELLVQE